MHNKQYLTISQLLFLILMLNSALKSVLADPERIRFKKVVVNNNGTYSIETPIETLVDPKILIAITVKNHAYSLPTFLATLETLKCPNTNKKCDLWIVFDNCEDKSYDIFTHWLSNTRTLFDSIIMINTKNDENTKEKHPELDKLYFSKNLKKRALIYALDKKFDYLLFLRADTILTNLETIKILISKKKSIVAPMLTSGESKYSTYWVYLDYENTDDNKYLNIYKRESIGCFKVAMLHDSYLIDLRDENIKFLLDENEEDEVSNQDNDRELSIAAYSSNILMHVCNRENFGYIPDLTDEEPSESFIHLRIEHLLKGPNKTYNQPLPITKFVENTKKRKTKLGFEKVYVINLERRKDRLERIQSTLDDLNLSYNIVKAVDGKKIDDEYLKNVGVRIIPDYKDPYYDRSVNFGEIGCFLSHYFIWKEMVENNYEKIIIFEDDARFKLGFKNYLNYFINQMKEKEVEWELLYLGRKIMKTHVDEENWNEKIDFRYGYGIVQPSYTHWTVAYALTLSGAKKLLKHDPIKRLLPVDEYLPVMFDKQPNKYWSSFYPERDLIAYAIQPSIIYPTHYVGEPSYVSDTENTEIIKKEEFELSENEIPDSVHTLNSQVNDEFKNLNEHQILNQETHSHDDL